MSRVETAGGTDRLPWLADDPAPHATQRRSTGLLGPAFAAVLLVAGVGAWFGARSVQDQSSAPSRRAPHSATVALPAPRAVAPVVQLPAQPEVRQSAEPEVRPAPTREVRIAPPARNATKEAEEAPKVAATEPAPAPAPAVVRPQASVGPWNPRIFNGAAGRIVQIGAFGSITQAKRGWWHMVRAYPAMSHLPAVVRPTRNSKGRIFYRFQVGTTSQAHSEVVCQRMQPIRFSCAVIGLPWKAKVER